jgi:hypothetical protein
VPRLGGADELVVGQIQGRRHLAKARRIAVGKGTRAQPFLLRRLLHLQTVLIGASEEEHVLAVEALEARYRVGRDRLVGMTDMRHPVGIGDGRRDVKFCLPAHGGRVPLSS